MVDQTATVRIVLKDEFTSRTKGVSGALKNVEKSVGLIGNAARNASAQLKGFFLPFVGVGAAVSAIRQIGEFERKLSEVAAVAGVSKVSDEFKALEATARRLGATTEFSARQAADGLLFLSQAGFNANQSIAALPATLNLALIGSLDLGQAADYASNVVSQFGLTAAETTRVVDVFSKTATSSNTNIQQLAEAMTFVGTTASAMGISIETVSAALGTLGDRGLQAGSAGAGLQRVLAALINPTAGAQEALAELGLTVEDVNPTLHSLADIFQLFSERGLDPKQAFDLFNDRGAKVGLTLAQSVDRLNELDEANKKAAGTADRLAKGISDNLVGAYRSFLSVLSEATLKVGDGGLLGALRSLVDYSADVIRALTGTEEEVAKLDAAARAGAVGVGLLGKALAALAAASVITAVGKLQGKFAGLKKELVAFIATPAFPLVAALLAVGKAVSALDEALERADKNARKVADSIQKIDRGIVATQARENFQQGAFNVLTLDVDGADKNLFFEYDALSEDLQERVRETKDAIAEIRVKDAFISEADVVEIGQRLQLLISELSKDSSTAAEEAKKKIEGVLNNSTVLGNVRGLAKLGVDTLKQAILDAQLETKRLADEAERLKEAATAAEVEALSGLNKLIISVGDQSEIASLKLAGASDESIARQQLLIAAQDELAKLLSDGVPVSAAKAIEEYEKLVAAIDVLIAKTKEQKAAEKAKESKAAIEEIIKAVRVESDAIGLTADQQARFNENLRLSEEITKGSLSESEAALLAQRLKGIQDLRTAREAEHDRQLKRIEAEKKAAIDAIDQRIEKLKEERADAERVGQGLGNALGTSVADAIKSGDVNSALASLQTKVQDIIIQESVVKPIEDAVKNLFTGELDAKIAEAEKQKALITSQDSLRVSVDALRSSVDASRGSTAGSSVGSAASPASTGAGGSGGSVDLSGLGGGSDTTAGTQTATAAGSSGGGGSIDTGALTQALGSSQGASSTSAAPAAGAAQGSAANSTAAVASGTATTAGASVGSAGTEGVLSSVGGAGGALAGIGGVLNIAGGVSSGNNAQTGSGVGQLIGLIVGLAFPGVGTILGPLIGGLLGGAIGGAFAEGGAVPGPARGDDRLIAVGGGEHVIKPAAVKHYGGHGNLDLINNMRLPKGAIGGHGRAASSARAGGGFGTGGGVARGARVSRALGGTSRSYLVASEEDFDIMTRRGRRPMRDALRRDRTKLANEFRRRNKK